MQRDRGRSRVRTSDAVHRTAVVHDGLKRVAVFTAGCPRRVAPADLNPAALPPIMSIFTRHLQVLFSRFDP